MGMALFDFSVFTIVVSAGLVAAALANPSPPDPGTPWTGAEGDTLERAASPTPTLDNAPDRFIIKP